jgi:hypothetical protein
MANKFPLVYDTTGKSLQELSTTDNLDLTGSSIVNAVNMTATGSVNAGSVVAGSLTVGGQTLGTVATSNDYNDLTNRPALFSGDYNDLTNLPSSVSSNWEDITGKPVIATSLSQLTNDTNFVTNAQINIIPGQVTGLATIATTGAFSDLTGVPNYVTNEQINGGTLTVEVSNTGDLQGSVFADDSSLMLDHLNNRLYSTKVDTDILTVNGILSTDDLSINAETQLSIQTDTYIAIQSTSFNLLNTVSGTTIYDVDELRFQGDVNFGLATVTGLTLNQVTGDLTGSVFADDSSVIVDGINRSVTADKVNTNELNSVLIKGNLQNSVPGQAVSITGDAGITLLPAGPLNVPNATSIQLAGTQGITISATNDLALSTSSGNITFSGPVDFTASTVTGLSVEGNFVGSVFGDDSTPLVDGINNKITGKIDSTEAIVNQGSYSLTVNSTGAKLQRTSGAGGGLVVTNASGVVLGGEAPVEISTAGDAIVIGNGSSGNITIGNGTNTVTVTNSTTLDLSDLTSISFSNSTISGLLSPSISYTPDDNTDWEGTPPDNVQDAIDRLVAWITNFKNNDSTDPNRPAP